MTGQGGFDASDDTVNAALDAILKSAKKHGVVAGLFAGSTDYALETISRGYRFVSIMTDTAILSNASASLVASVRAGLT